jgi:hypothetical protein
MFRDKITSMAGSDRQAFSQQSSSCFPNFLLVGAAKCGTTTLYHYLQQHPDILMSSPKEPKFFSGRATNPGKGPGDVFAAQNAVDTFDDYCELFRKGINKRAVGEASVDTFFHFDQTIPAIQHYLGDPRIIIILRNPVDRAYSAYNFLVRDGYETLSFEDALISEEQRRQDEYRHMWRYREGGLYAHRVRAFQESFSRVQVVLFDDLKADPCSLMQSVYGFLEVDALFSPDTSHRYNVSGIPRWRFLNTLFVRPKRMHKAVRTIGGAILGADRWIHLRDRIRLAILHKPARMAKETETALKRYYRNDILNLQDRIHRNLSNWL